MDKELEIAKRMEKYIKEGKSILEAQALAKMEVILEIEELNKEQEPIVKKNEAELFREKEEKELLENKLFVDKYHNLSTDEKQNLKKEYINKENWRLLMISETGSKLEYLRRYYEKDNEVIKLSSNSNTYESKNVKVEPIKLNVKCQKCKSNDIELTNSGKVKKTDRLSILMGSIGLAIIINFVGILGILGTFLSILIIIGGFILFLDPREEKIYHCKTCNTVFKKGWGQ